jgi:ribosomal-protein-alanine N-acetyltransferase
MIAVVRDVTPVLRPMREQDVAWVSSIETSTYPYPWSEGIFSDCLKVRYCCWVVEWKKTIAGYGIMSLGADEAHILNVCMRNDVRRHGLGRLMLSHLLEEAAKRDIHTAFLEVRPSNRGAIALYVSEGFECIGTRKNYYQAHEGREDAWVFRIRRGEDGWGT